MKTSGNQALDDGAPTNKPRPSPRRAHYHSARSSRATSLNNGLKAKAFSLRFKLMLPCFASLLGNHKIKVERGSMEIMERAPGLESRNLAPSIILPLTHWQASHNSLPCARPLFSHLMNEVIGLTISENFFNSNSLVKTHDYAKDFPFWN